MREGEQSDRIQVVVDSSKMVWCKWCGLRVSVSWQHTQRGIFCSAACAYADSASHVDSELLCCVSIWLIPVIVVFPLFVVRWEFWTVVIPIMMIELLTFYYFRKWIVHRYLVPRDYRRNEVLFDTALLATVSTSVTCPRCDANLELQSIGRNRTYVCGHCGATGAIAVIDKGEREVITRDRFGRPISGL